MNTVGISMMAPLQQGTILPGTTIQLGRYAVVIDRYIAEGGFAHVYLATLTNGTAFPVVVKRIAVADKERLAIVNKEIETMKRLGKHKNIVEYMDSCMGKLEGGGYEVLILMEYCGGGPVIDIMNRRLQHRLTEPEILKIFSNVCEAVAYLHYSNPPILHRDIKVENILLSHNDYKLCDFGSATTNILRGDNIPRNVKDIQLLEEEINSHTTLQYRAPEMIDLYMRKGIDEKIDIWALGVLLYKLCYYTTPFEEQGQLAILNVRYTIPEHPVFSIGLINLFKSMLQENPRQRPNIYQVMKATSSLRGLPCPIQNIYSESVPALSSSELQQPSSATANILSNTTVTRPMDVLPSIEPMRRGRPTRVAQPTAAHPDLNSGFDDSFGQLSQTTDPASQFSKFPLAGDAFDFGSPAASFDSGSKSESKRFTLDFGAGKDEFGFDFAGTDSKDTPLSGSETRPRPPSGFESMDPVLPELSATTSRQSSQLSGMNNTSVGKSKPTAEDLFFGSSAGIQFESSGSGGSRSGTPTTFSSVQQAPVGLSSPSSNAGSLSSSSGMTKPLLPSRQANPPSSSQAYTTPSFRTNGSHPVNPSVSAALNRSIHSDGTGNSRTGLSTNASPNLSATDTGARTQRSGVSMPLDSSLELLQRQQIEQLGKLSLDSTGAPINPQNTQGKAKVLDPSRTLDGMQSLEISSKNAVFHTGALSSSASSALAPSALTPRPQAASTPILSMSSTSPSVSSSTSALPSTSLDKKAMSQRDLDAELKLIQLQQKEFERQQQELFAVQRRELEEQQRQHRAQQEQLQRLQQQQIQLQHEKYQERKRMLKEQELLTERQMDQQKELERQHEAQTLMQKQQQQEQQKQQQSLLPDISNVAASMASISLNTTDRDVIASTVQLQQKQQYQQQLQQQASSNPYRLSITDTANGQKAAVIYPAMLSNSSGHLDHLSTPGSGRASLDDTQDRFRFNSGYSSHSSSPSPSTSLQSLISSHQDTAGVGAPSIPVKSARRAAATVVNGSTTSISTTPTATTATPSGSFDTFSDSSSSPAAAVQHRAVAAATAKARRASMNGSNPSLGLGHKPELLPKPTRFRMKDGGTGTLVAGEEEAFRRKFPSAELDEDLIQIHSYSSASQRPRGGGDEDVVSTSPRAPSSNESSRSQGMQYMTPSQRARLGRTGQLTRNGNTNGFGEEGEVDEGQKEGVEEEEEETLVRSRRRQNVNAAGAGSEPGAGAGSVGRTQQKQRVAKQVVVPDTTTESSTPIESVRERVQRMNRVGRIVS